MIYREERIKYVPQGYKRINNQNLKTEKENTEQGLGLYKFSANEIFIQAYAIDCQIYGSRDQEKGKGKRYKDFKFIRINI